VKLNLRAFRGKIYRIEPDVIYNTIQQAEVAEKKENLSTYPSSLTLTSASVESERK